MNRRPLEAVLVAYLIVSMVVPMKWVGVSQAEAQSGPAPSTLLPGFGGSTAPPRMLVIMDTSKSMRFSPDNTQEFATQDFSPTGGSPTNYTVSAAEGGTATLDCTGHGGRISAVKAAYYGKAQSVMYGTTTDPNDLNHIAPPTWAPTDNATNCGASSTPQAGTPRGWLDETAFIQSTCLNQATCAVTVNSSNLNGDPCVGLSKKLAVYYTCDTDPCPATAGSKFCLAKKALYSAIDMVKTGGLLEVAAGGYAQFDYYPWVDPSNSNYATSCRYDVVKDVAPTNTTSPSMMSDATTVFLSGSSLTPLTPVVNPAASNITSASETNYDAFTCHPEQLAVFNSMTTSTGIGKIYGTSGNGCKPQTAKNCRQYWDRKGTYATKWQNPKSSTCAAVKPTGPTSHNWVMTNSTANDCIPATIATDHQFAGTDNGTPASGWAGSNELLVPAANFSGGVCSAEPTAYTDVYYSGSTTYGTPVTGASPSLSAGSSGALTGAVLGTTAQTNCNATGKCAFFPNGTTASNTSIRNITINNPSFGTSGSSFTINSQAYNQVTGQTNITVAMPQSAFGGVCPTAGTNTNFTGTIASTLASLTSNTTYTTTFNATAFISGAATPTCTTAGNGNGSYGCRITANSTASKTLYTCPSGYTASASTPTTSSSLTCTQKNYMHTQTGVTTATGANSDRTAWSAGSSGSDGWVTFTYDVKLTDYSTNLAASTDICVNALTTVTGSTYPAGSPSWLVSGASIPCGSSLDPANGGGANNSGGSSKCDIQRASEPTLHTDTGTVTCNAKYYYMPYTRTATPLTATACLGTITPYKYDFITSMCPFRRFIYRFDQVEFTYRWLFSAGDYGGSFDQPAAYPTNVPAGKAYCDSASSRKPDVPASISDTPFHDTDVSATTATPSSAAGFEYTVSAFTNSAPNTCAPQLAPGVGGCPAASNGVQFCKLRWSSGGTTGRFQNVYNGTASVVQPAFTYNSTPSYLASGSCANGVCGNLGRVGCQLGDPLTYDHATRSVTTTWQDWCNTTSTTAYSAGYMWPTPTRMADFYTTNSAFSNYATNRSSTWPAIWGASGGANPFASSGTSSITSLAHSSEYYKDTFCVVDENGNQVCGGGSGASSSGYPGDPFTTGKSSGLSLMHTTHAATSGGSTPVGSDFNFGMSFSRWPRSMSCTTTAQCQTAFGASSSCVSLQCTDPNYADRLLNLFNAYNASTNPWGLRMPDQGDITPLAGSLSNALDYINATKASDGLSGCRRYSVLLVTDGYEEPAAFGGVANDPVAAVTALKAAGVNVYVVGFGITGGVLDQMAQAAGTAVDSSGNLSASGGAYNASNFVTLQSAIQAIIGAQLSGYYARSKPTLTSTGDRIYSAYFSYQSSHPKEFLGYLDAFPVTSGALNATPAWKFDQVLNGSGTRTMVTRIRGNVSGTLDNFDISPGCTLVKDMCVNSPDCGHNACGTADGDYVDSVIEFVRNDRSGTQAGTYTDFTPRTSRISDIFYSQPAPISAPNASTLWASLSNVTGPDADNASGAAFDGALFNASYTAFKSANSTRELQVFVHSNDGVLHAVRDSTAATAPSWAGAERWGYVPSQSQARLFSRMNGHEFLADGSFGSADVCFGQTACEGATGSGWKTILVGALGRAGPYLYGLDVTNATWTAPRWLWDINPDAKDYPGTPATTNLDSDSMNMGFATSAPVVARVRVENDPYTWGVFVGGGYPDITRDTSANNDCTDDSTMGYTEWENGNYFYVYDANPANRPGCPGLCGASPSLLYGAGHTARWCIRGVNKTGTSVDRMNGVPGRPGVVRQNSNSRASTVYFGDLDGKVWRMDVTSKHIANWTPRVWFNPYDQATDGSSIDSSCFMSPATSTNVQPAPDITGSPAARSMPLAVPSTADGLGPIWLRPYRAQDTSTNRDVFYIGTGDPMNPNSSTTNQRNYFYAVEDQTDIAGGESALPGGSGGVCPAAVLWSYYFDNFQKVLSDPVIIGNNIIVGVYVPPGGATGCGAPGYSKLYCFDRMTGSPNACLSSNTTTSSVDDPNPTSGGLRRWVKAGDGMLSDLAAVGNSVVYTTSTNPGVPVQKNVQNVNLPFRVRSWRRIQ